MKKDALTRKLTEKERPAECWADERWLYFKPTTFLPEVKEWGGSWRREIGAFRLPKLTSVMRKIHDTDPLVPTSDEALLLLGDWDQRAIVKGRRNGRFNHLYDFQKRAHDALLTRPYHGELLALSPGLGKTPTSIVAADSWVKEHGESKRILVVAPLSLLKNWEREITGHQIKDPFQWSSDPRVEICHQMEPTPDRSVRWTITNYDSILERGRDPHTKRVVVTGWLNEAFDLNWDIVIFDESVLLKNRKAKRVRAALALANCAKRVWLLSGAPITRDNSDLWQQMQIIEPEYFSSFWRFAKEYCVVIESQWSNFEIVGSRKDKDMRHDFPELMFIRNQEEVFPELPEYIWQDVELELHPKQQKAHDEVIEEWIHELEENRDRRVEVTAVIAMLVRLQQITSNLYNLQTAGSGDWPDYSAKADYVEELLDSGQVDWPVLIWTHHRPGAHALYDRLTRKTKKRDSALYGRRVELVYGGTKDRDTQIEDYKSGKIDVLILGIQVGKYGHTLVNTRTVITYDKTWDSDAWFQMLHRVRRNGLTHRPLVINPRCRGTVDDYVELNLAGKLPDMAKLTGADLAKILRSLGEEFVT